VKESIFTTHHKVITMDSCNDMMRIIPIGDVHKDSPNHDGDKWKSFIKGCKPTNKQNLYLGMGDFQDFMAYGERKRIKSTKLHESTVTRFDRMALSDVTETLDDLWFTKGQWIGLIQGNHTWEFDTGPASGMSSTEYMAKRLKTKWLGDLAYIRLTFKFKNRNTRCSIDIVAAHGKAGGKLAGTTINQVDDLREIFPVADIYIMGHDHKRGAWPNSTIVMNSGKNGLVMHQKRQWLCRSGSFLRGFVEDQPSYLVRMLKKPAELGAIELHVRFKRSCAGANDIISPDIHAYV